VQAVEGINYQCNSAAPFAMINRMCFNLQIMIFPVSRKGTIAILGGELFPREKRLASMARSWSLYFREHCISAANT
jgi:hypothetical protein